MEHSPDATSAEVQKMTEQRESLDAKLPASAATKASLAMAVNAEFGSEPDKVIRRHTEAGKDILLTRDGEEMSFSTDPIILPTGVLSVDSAGSTDRAGDSAAGVAIRVPGGYRYSVRPTGDAADPWEITKDFYRGGTDYHFPNGEPKVDITEAEGKEWLNTFATLKSNDA